MKKEHLFVSIIILIQGIIISLLIYNIGRTHRTVEIASIDKNSIVFSPNSPLKHFFEPKANTIIKNSPRFFNLPYTPYYTINKDNLNERFNYAIQKPENTIRIITLGDSYTFGHYVNTKDNWTEQLEDMLKNTCETTSNYEVINLAERGYDISYSVERFKKRGIKYDSDVVLWLIKDDDFDEVNDIVRPLSKNYEKEMEKNNNLKELFKKGDIYPYTEKAKKEFLSMFTKNTVLSAQKKFLEEFSTQYKKTIVFIPLNLSKEYLQILTEIDLPRKKTFISSYLPSFEKLPDNHPSVGGHKTIAQNVLNYLLQQNIIPCK